MTGYALFERLIRLCLLQSVAHHFANCPSWVAALTAVATLSQADFIELVVYTYLPVGALYEIIRDIARIIFKAWR